MCSPHGTLGYNPNCTYSFSNKCSTYPFSDKCPHRSTQLSHRGVRSGECLRKLQTSTLPLSEGGILCHAKSVTEVVKLHPGLVRTSTTCSSVGRYCTNTSFLYTMSRMKWYLISRWFDLSRNTGLSKIFTQL
jgi:hypothetical protein